MSTNHICDELSKDAQRIEQLAKDLQIKLAQGDDPLTLAHELVALSSRLTFDLGGFYILESKATMVANHKGDSNPNYYHVRDRLGRFTKI
jgi:hypothetical protein